MSQHRPEQKRDYRISRLRIMCILLVVLAHSMIIYKSGWGLYTTDVKSPVLNHLCRFIYLFHMPLFFSISGYLAAHTYGKIKTTKNLAANKAKRLLVPYLVIGLLYLLPIRYLAHYSNYLNNSLCRNIINNIILGNDNGHIWFLAALFIIFISHHLIDKSIKSKKARLVIILLITVSGFFLPSYIGSAFKNILWFHLGFMLNNDRKKPILNKHTSILLFIAMTSVFFILPCTIPCYKLISQIVNMGVSYVAILAAFQIVPNKKPGRIGTIIERNSMGIYLFHSPLIYFTFAYYPNISPILMLIINLVGFGIIALLLTLIIRKTGLKFLLGE